MRTMRRVVLLTALAVLLVPAAAASAARRFSGVALGNAHTGNGKIAQHHFVVGDGYLIRLRDRARGHTGYRVCLLRNNRRLRCATGRTGLKGRGGSFGTKGVIAPGRTGPYVYRWFVRGRNVAQWRVSIGVGD